MPRDRHREDDVRPISDRLEVGPVDPDARRAHRRSRWIRRILLITAIVVGVGGGALFAQLRAKTTPVSVDDSLTRFRESTGESSSAVEGLPDPGVYVYATEGGDEVTVLGGSRHRYPPETTLTVTPDACGVKLRWDALGERWEEWTLCPEAGRLEIRSIVTYHQFFGQGDHREYFCGEESVYLPSSRRAGATWTARCAGAGATAATTGEVVGVEFLSVGGTRVRSLHVRFETTFEGDTVGTRTTQAWLVLPTGLPVVTVQTDDLETESVLGRTHYAERFRIELTSVEPRT